MIYRFPHRAAFLPRVKLSYVNLPGLLSDGKRDRASRNDGYVSIQLGERCHLVFMRAGEPVYAARLGAEPGDRGPDALSRVVRIAGTESERGEGGQIGYFGAPPEQLRLMASTLAGEPVVWDEPLDPARPERFFPRLQERAFSGVLELCADGAFHYLSFRDGAFREGFFCDRDESVGVGEFVRRLLEGSAGSLRATLFPELEALPEQASPGYVDLYRRVIGGTMREVGATVGRDAAVGMMRRAQAVVATERPVAGQFDVTDEGRIAGDVVASPEEVTDAAAAWLTEVLVSASDHYGVDPGGVLEKVGRDSRFVLREHGFFQRLPWALAL